MLDRFRTQTVNPFRAPGALVNPRNGRSFKCVSFVDVLEEIVGDIRDEFEIEHGLIFEFIDPFIVVSVMLTIRELLASTGLTFEWLPKETAEM